MNRIVVYIDGFNLYYGLRSKGWRRYYWLDLCRLSQNLLRAKQRLVMVRYFTAGVLPEPGDPDKPTRQNAYLEALATLPDLRAHYGYHVPKPTLLKLRGDLANLRGENDRRQHCGRITWGRPRQCLRPAIIVSGDGDLASPVRAVRERYPGKRIVAFAWATFGRAPQRGDGILHHRP